jgi:hypothetical protein
MRQVILLLLALVACPFAAISTVTLPNEDINGVDTPQVVWVDQNFDTLKVKQNQVIDTVNGLQAGTAAFTGLTALTPLYLNSSKRPTSGTFTGTGFQFVLSASPTLTGTLTAAEIAASDRITAAGGVAITGGTPGNGRITKDAANGLDIRAVTGTNQDLTILAASGNGVFQIPTGTSDVLLSHSSGTTTVRGPFAAASTIVATGTVTADSIISSKFYTEGTFTLTGTGFTTSPTGTARYTRVGKMVVLYIPSIQAVSNSTSLTYTGVPAAIRPARRQTVPAEALIDNTANYLSGWIDVETDGTLIVMSRASATAFGSFTASNTKGISGLTITYTIQ